jgi:Protein of unknown function (DUF2786).
MIKLGNLKTGQTKDLENGVVVTKEDGHYRVVVAGQGTARLRFLKDERQWRFVIDEHQDGVEYHLPEGTTGKDAVDVLIANWPAKPEPKVNNTPAATESQPVDPREKALEKIRKLLAAGNDPTLPEGVAEGYLGRAAALMAAHSVEAEELRRAEGGEAGQGDDEIIEWAFPINVQGGHSPHRVAAYWPVVKAFGADGYSTHHRTKGLGYKHDVVHLHVIAQEAVIQKIKDFLVIMELAMERQADVVSRRESSRSRAEGGHHSLAGCKARRGFMRGFGQGIADRLRKDVQEYVAGSESSSTALVVADRAAQVAAYMKLNHGDLKPTRALDYDRSAFGEGRGAGRSFASPAVEEPAAGREAINA